MTALAYQRGTNVIAALVMVLVAAVICAASAAPRAGDVQIDVQQVADGAVRIQYIFSKPRRVLHFRDVPNGYRERRWTIETVGFQLIREEHGDRIVRGDGTRFQRVTIIARPDLVRMRKNYQPLAHYGDDGLLLYTGHFWPVTRHDKRTNAKFSFVPVPEAKVVAFGERVDKLTDWRSPMAHPAFVYMGPVKPTETQDALALVDPAAPNWIREEFNTLAPATFEFLRDAFQFSHENKPNVFLSAPRGPDDGRLNFSGDALPLQFQITLDGSAWKTPSDKSLSTFRHSTIHEIVHLWQAEARPRTKEDAPWIHEGGADAIAAEAMVRLGYWDTTARLIYFQRAKSECARKLKSGSLENASARGDYRAFYACGHIIAIAVSRADGTTVSEFWRTFIEAAKADGGYSKSLYFRFIEGRVPDSAFNETLRLFVATPHGDPAKAIEQLFAKTATQLAPGGGG